MTAHDGLRVWPTLAGAVVAIAVGSLLSGGLCAARQDPTFVEVVLLPFAQWMLAAWCIYAANQGWVDRDREGRAELFARCVAIALLTLVPMWIAAANVFFALGGRP